MTVHNVTKEWTNETTKRQTQRNGVSSRMRISALRLKMTSTNALSSLVGKRWLRLDLVKGRIQPSAYNRIVAFFQDTAFEPGPVIFANPAFAAESASGSLVSSAYHDYIQRQYRGRHRVRTVFRREVLPALRSDNIWVSFLRIVSAIPISSA